MTTERATPSATSRPPRLLDRLRAACRLRHYSPRTEDCYADWVRRFILFHGQRHPLEMGAAETNRFLTDLGGERPRQRFDPEPGVQRAIVSLPGVAGGRSGAALGSAALVVQLYTSPQLPAFAP